MMPTVSKTDAPCHELVAAAGVRNLGQSKAQSPDFEPSTPDSRSPGNTCNTGPQKLRKDDKENGVSHASPKANHRINQPQRVFPRRTSRTALGATSVTTFKVQIDQDFTSNNSDTFYNN